MIFKSLSPEVAGGWGPNTEFTRTPGVGVTVQKLHYMFDGWLGDALLESISCYIVLRVLGNRLLSCKFSGFELKPVETSVSEEFRDLYADLELPDFVWLDITGRAGIDDFGMSKEGLLVVSDSALSVLNEFQLANCDIEDYS